MNSKIFLFGCLLFISFSFISCYDCDGSDIIHKIENVSNKLINDTIDAKYNVQGQTDLYQVIYFFDSLSSRKGTRNCRQKDLAISAENNVVISQIELSANIDFVCDEDTIWANYNFINNSKVRNSIKNDFGIGFESESAVRFSCKPLKTDTLMEYKIMTPLSDGNKITKILKCFVK